MAPYARLEAALTLLIGGLLTAAIGYWWGWWALAPAVFTLALLSFYRDPPRRVPAGDRLLISPADGRILSVGRNLALPGSPAPQLRIHIFLSVLNVHVNRAPCAGRVLAIEYKKGEFLNALKPECSDCNEANAVTLEPAGPLPGPVRVRQIAGLLAKRIVCVLKPGDRVAAGERFGMIKLGSQTELCVPEDPRWRVNVKAGDAVKGGLTVLAELADR